MNGRKADMLFLLWYSWLSVLCLVWFNHFVLRASFFFNKKTIRNFDVKNAIKIRDKNINVRLSLFFWHCLYHPCVNSFTRQIWLALDCEGGFSVKRITCQNNEEKKGRCTRNAYMEAIFGTELFYCTLHLIQVQGLFSLCAEGLEGHAIHERYEFFYFAPRSDQRRKSRCVCVCVEGMRCRLVHILLFKRRLYRYKEKKEKT